MFLFLNDELKISEFKSINKLEDNYVLIHFKNFDLAIKGNNLKLKYYYKEELILKGRFLEINYQWK